MLSFYSKIDNQDSFTQITSIRDDCLIISEEATLQDLQSICQLTNLHLADISDSLDLHELPRMEKIQNYLIVFTRHPIEQVGHLHTIPLTILLSNSYSIIISPSKSALIKDLLQKKDLSSLYTPSKFLVQILLKIAQEFSSQIKKARNTVMNQAKEMNAIESEDIFTLTEQEEVLNQYLSSLDPLQNAIENLSRTNFESFHEKAHYEIDDILNSIKQSKDLCNNLLKGIRNLRDSYQIVFANKLTKTIKLLTALTIIFSIPNMIASIYGMNVHLPLSTNAHAFSLLLVAMFLISILCGYWFYRKKWL